MSADLIPELYEKIHNEFKRQISSNNSVQAFYKKLEAQKATPEDVSSFSGDVGECASQALCKYLSEDIFPDGIMTFDIAEQTIKRLLIEVYQIVNDAAAEVQKIEDDKIDIHLNPQRAAFPKERVDDLLNKLISILERNE